jgi:large subunit ribosomal protein L21
MYVVFEAKGFQWATDVKSRIKLPRMDNKVGEKITFDKVLLVKNEEIMIGQPYLEGVKIEAVVIGHGRDRKIIVYKYRRRNRYRKTRGHKQQYTEIEIKDIILKKESKARKASGVKKEDKAKKESKVKKEKSPKKKELKPKKKKVVVLDKGKKQEKKETKKKTKKSTVVDKDKKTKESKKKKER